MSNRKKVLLVVYKDIPKSVQKFMEDITQKCGDIHADWAKNFTAAFANTLLTTVKKQNDGTRKQGPNDLNYFMLDGFRNGDMYVFIRCDHGTRNT